MAELNLIIWFDEASARYQVELDRGQYETNVSIGVGVPVPVHHLLYGYDGVIFQIDGKKLELRAEPCRRFLLNVRNMTVSQLLFGFSYMQFIMLFIGVSDQSLLANPLARLKLSSAVTVSDLEREVGVEASTKTALWKSSYGHLRACDCLSSGWFNFTGPRSLRQKLYRSVLASNLIKHNGVTHLTVIGSAYLLDTARIILALLAQGHKLQVDLIDKCYSEGKFFVQLATFFRVLVSNHYRLSFAGLLDDTIDNRCVLKYQQQQKTAFDVSWRIGGDVLSSQLVATYRTEQIPRTVIVEDLVELSNLTVFSYLSRLRQVLPDTSRQFCINKLSMLAGYGGRLSFSDMAFYLVERKVEGRWLLDAQHGYSYLHCLYHLVNCPEISCLILPVMAAVLERVATMVGSPDPTPGMARVCAGPWSDIYRYDRREEQSKINDDRCLGHAVSGSATFFGYSQDTLRAVVDKSRLSASPQCYF